MAHPIRVDNSRPVTAYDTARTLGVSKKRTAQIIRDVQSILSRDPKTGEFVVRAKRSGKNVNRSHNASTKFKKTHSSQTTSAARRKASR